MKKPVFCIECKYFRCGEFDGYSYHPNHCTKVLCQRHTSVSCEDIHIGLGYNDELWNKNNNCKFFEPTFIVWLFGSKCKCERNGGAQK